MFWQNPTVRLTWQPGCKNILTNLPDFNLYGPQDGPDARRPHRRAVQTGRRQWRCCTGQDGCFFAWSSLLPRRWAWARHRRPSPSRSDRWRHFQVPPPSRARRSRADFNWRSMRSMRQAACSTAARSSSSNATTSRSRPRGSLRRVN